jgi:hypothetical protein
LGAYITFNKKPIVKSVWVPTVIPAGACAWNCSLIVVGDAWMLLVQRAGLASFPLAVLVSFYSYHREQTLKKQGLVVF